MIVYILETRMLNESHLASCPILDKLVRAVHSIIRLLQTGRRSRHTRISSWDAQLEGGRKGVDPALISPASSGELTTVRPKVRCIMSLLITACLSCCHRSMLLLSLISTPSTTSVFHQLSALHAGLPFWHILLYFEVCLFVPWYIHRHNRACAGH